MPAMPPGVSVVVLIGGHYVACGQGADAFSEVQTIRLSDVPATHRTDIDGRAVPGA